VVRIILLLACTPTRVTHLFLSFVHRSGMWVCTPTDVPACSPRTTSSAQTAFRDRPSVLLCTIYLFIYLFNNHVLPNRGHFQICLYVWDALNVVVVLLHSWLCGIWWASNRPPVFRQFSILFRPKRKSIATNHGLAAERPCRGPEAHSRSPHRLYYFGRDRKTDLAVDYSHSF